MTSPTFVGTTAPSGTRNTSGFFHRKGKQLVVDARANWSVAGIAVTRYSFTNALPSRLSSKVIISTGWVYVSGVGGMGTGTTGPIATSLVWLVGSTGTVVVDRVATSMRVFEVNVNVLLQ